MRTAGLLAEGCQEKALGADKSTLVGVASSFARRHIRKSSSEKSQVFSEKSLALNLSFNFLPPKIFPRNFPR